MISSIIHTRILSKIEYIPVRLLITSCSRYDYLTIKNETNQTFGRYTGLLYGKFVDVTGQYAVLSFKSDGSISKSGYVLRFYFYS